MVEDVIIEMVARKFKISRTKLHKNSSFSSLDASFFDIYELLLMCEKEFLLDIDDALVDRAKTVRDFIHYIEGRQC